MTKRVLTLAAAVALLAGCGNSPTAPRAPTLVPAFDAAIADEVTDVDAEEAAKKAKKKHIPGACDEPAFAQHAPPDVAAAVCAAK